MRKWSSVDKFSQPLYVCSRSAIFNPLSLSPPICPFRVIKGKEKKVDFIFIHQHCCFSLLYNIIRIHSTHLDNVDIVFIDFLNVINSIFGLV